MALPSQGVLPEWLVVASSSLVVAVAVEQHVLKLMSTRNCLLNFFI